MEELINQIRLALRNRLYLVALQSLLTLPDICSALSSKDGFSDKHRYIEWYDNNIKENQNLSGRDCYYFRCGMLHQGRAEHEQIDFKRIIFLEPNSDFKLSGNTFNSNGEKALNIDLELFCNEILNSVLNWWNLSKDNNLVMNNYEKMIKCYSNGIPPFIVGISVIG